MSCNIRCYGVLGDVSIGYPPDTGKLLTCYAPFRRSPPEYCYPALPLDLHVLSLPLAFILSQDQTLHCTSFILYSSSTILTSSSLKGIYALMYFVLPYTSHTFFKYAACLYHYFNQLPFVSRTGLQRYAFFLSFQIQIKNFCIFFGIIFLLSNRLSATR